MRKIGNRKKVDCVMQASQQYFFTKNEVFNEIANLRWGSSLLILDETHFESILFLDALLQKSLPPAKMHIVSYHETGATLETMKLDLERYTSLQEISIIINRLREQIGSHGVIIHHYLPHVLTRESEESVLRMLEFWTTKTAEKNLIEFYTLPQGTFPNVEKKASAFMTGEISIKFAKTAPERQLSFILKRACKPEYHLVEFPFMTKNNQLLIKWGEEFTDTLPRDLEEQVEQKIAYLRENIQSLTLRMVSTPSQGLTPHDYLLLTQIDGMHLDDVQVMFPDKFDVILKKLARWNLQGVIYLEKVEKRGLVHVKDRFSLLTKIALSLPTSIAVPILYRKPRRVPTESYIALRRGIETICDLFMPTQGGAQVLPSVEEFAQEIATRITAIERIKAAGEDPRIKFDMKYLPTIVSLTLQISFGLKPVVRVKPQGAYEIRLAACSLCKGVKSDSPICHMITAMLIGACAVPFKRSFTCNEVQCKAMGDDACVFIVRPE